MRTFPKTEHYDVGDALTSLGIGEALVAVLSPKGVPTPLAATRLVPPDYAVDDATLANLIAAERSPVATARRSTVGLAEDAKNIGVGFVKDLLTTADGRRTLRTVFGALFKKG